MIGKTISHYRILEKVGEGGMGQVYRACDEHLSRDVALKVFPPGTLVDESARKRFRKEARALSQLSHPNIATLYDFDTQEGVDFLAMEFIGGQGLSERIAAGPLPEREIAQLGAQLAEGLAAAHAVRVIHCDIKPDNLRITDDGRLKIVDFGLAKITKPPRTDRITTSSVESHAVAGTLPYMAPEQVSSQPLDARTDIYSAGAVLYEMATGKRPFREDTNLQLADSILHKPLTPPSRWNDRISPQLEDVILKCLEKEPDDRYATAADLLVDLRALQRPRSGSHESSARYAVRPRKRSRKPLIAGLSLVLCAAVLAAIPSVRQRVKRWMNIDPVPSEKLVAVLPFTVVGGDAQAIPFSEGLTETLTAKLTQLTLDPKLQVVPAPEIRDKGAKALDDVRREFGVTMVLQGNLYWFQDNLRINMVLIDTRTRRQVRAESLVVPAADPFAVQDRIVMAAVGMLDLDVPAEELKELASRNTQSAKAYDLYLQGLGYLQNYDKKENIQNAIHAFENALALDANFAAAYAGRGDADWQM
ncbi:MAG: protein kinase domain-containing protein, partial [Candidatus Sulfotelmatobacter sp.]